MNPGPAPAPGPADPTGWEAFATSAGMVPIGVDGYPITGPDSGIERRGRAHADPDLRDEPEERNTRPVRPRWEPRAPDPWRGAP